jgi:2-phospho-L-lactate guanylyltransferase (CobY/MobA/RfbA family)
MDRKKAVPAEWSRRRTRHDPPDLDEAIAAVQGLTDQIESQVEVAAQLSGLPEEDVRCRVLMTQAQFARSRPAPARGRQTEVVVIKRRGLRTN